MYNSKYLLIIILKVFFLLSLIPSDSNACSSLYTVQLGSFHKLAPAQKQFNDIMHKLKEENLMYLRVEKIGKFYPVRAGLFKDRAGAEKLLDNVKSFIPSAIILKACFINERISNMYKNSAETPDEQSLKESSVNNINDQTEPLTSEKTGRKISEYHVSGSLEEKIRVISDLVSKGDYKEAQHIINMNLDAQPDSAELNGWHGTVLLKIELPEMALEYFKKASELSPGQADYHNGTGYSLFLLNRFGEAADEFKEAIALDPKHIDALTGLGITYIKTNENNKAAALHKKIKTLDAATAEKLLNIISQYKN